jgi:G3E family GTPase
MRRIRAPKDGAPVVLVAGVSATPMVSAAIALQWDLPSVVAVQHSIDPAREVLVRTVSDITGLIERVEIDVEHACTSCAIREDIVPTLERLAASGTWETIVAQLPVTAEPMQVCRVVEGMPGVAPHVRIAGVVVALDAATLVDDLVGDDLVAERGLSLVKALARPGAIVSEGTTGVDPAALARGIHNHPEAEDWVSPVCLTPVAEPAASDVWTLDFRSDRPFHPQRLRERVEVLGGGHRRTRGCFWLPTRPTQVCQWEGAGGMLSIGAFDDWYDMRPHTRIVVVGTDEGRDTLEAALRSCLLTDDEIEKHGLRWRVPGDGLEPWLGPVDGVSEVA